MIFSPMKIWTMEDVYYEKAAHIFKKGGGLLWILDKGPLNLTSAHLIVGEIGS